MGFRLWGIMLGFYWGYLGRMAKKIENLGVIGIFKGIM